MLLPVAVLTSWFFNDVLVPGYLLMNKTGSFIKYFLYSFIISLWLQMLVLTAALILIGNYNVSNLSPLISSGKSLALIIYLIVFIQAFIQLFVRIRSIKDSKNREPLLKKSIMFRVDRQNRPVDPEDIVYVESRSDYIEIQTETERIVTRERISHVHGRLPAEFIRVHRSFIVNSHRISAFSMEEIRLEKHTVPVGRKFRPNLKKLNLSDHEKVN
jgi:DNA-binding LytR/AlgR family response regulator